MLLAWPFVRGGILILFSCVIAVAQAGPSPTLAPPPPAGDDSDPTRPVVWSLREEYYNLPPTGMDQRLWGSKAARS
jgi:hypothetical protein